MSCEIVSILELSLEEDVHHTESERRVRSGANRNPFIALSRRARAQWIDRNNRRAATASLEHEGPEMRIRGERIRSPQENEITLRKSLGVGADVGAERHAHADRSRHRADGAVE